ncbi:hypothetical protein VTK26DRAFT_6718 [Humicola hyalothermophila]
MTKEQPSSARRQPEDSDSPETQQANPSSGRDPIAATPNIGSPASPAPAARVAFASANPSDSDAATGAQPPSSVGLGIDPVGQPRGYQEYRGYHPVHSFDSFQVFPDESDGQPGDPPLKGGFQQRDHLIPGPDAPTYYYPQQHGPHNAESSRWPRWRWTGSAWPMYGMFCVGVIFAGAHHAFYNHLDRRPADDQIGMIRIGGFLSYAAKSSLLAAVIFAYRQQTWVTARRKVLRLRTIDSLFAAVNEPLALLNWEFIKMARVAVTLAVLAWFFPLTVILTPASLTVSPLLEVRDDRCYGIRTLNFEPEKHKNWREPTLINGHRGLSLATYNSTLPNSATVFTPFNDTFFDYWTGRSGQIDLVSKQAALTQQVIPRRNVALETCGLGWNCSYTISFQAPGYKCAEIARGRELDRVKLWGEGVPFDASHLIPVGTYSYIAYTNEGDYYRYQMNLTEDRTIDAEPPYPKNLGAFRTEPVLWIGYATATGEGRPPANSTQPGWDEAFEAAVMRCEHYLTDYTVLFNHTFTDQTTTVLKRDFLHPIINTTLVPPPKLEDGTVDRNSTDGTNDWNKAVPESNYVFPLDVERYRLTAAYHTLGHTMRNFLDGTVQYDPFALVLGDMDKTGLIDTETYLPVAKLVDEVQAFYERIILSTLSEPRFLIVAWAAKPDEPSGVELDTSDPELAYPCTKTRVINAYKYNRRDMWIAYAVAILVSLFCVVLGTAALAQNNYHVRDTHVSSFVAATRAPCLEALPWKSSKWGEVSDEILDTRLGYGIIADRGPNGTPMPGVTGFNNMGSPGGTKVYYGFAPPEVLERTRAATFGPGRPRPRSTAFSFKTWETGDERMPYSWR